MKTNTLLTITALYSITFIVLGVLKDSNMVVLLGIALTGFIAGYITK